MSTYRDATVPSKDETAQLVQLMGEQEPHITPHHMFTRLAWSRIAEPGDSTAVTLVAGLGAERALQMLISGAEPTRIATAFADAGEGRLGELTATEIKKGIRRWAPRLSREGTQQDIARAVNAGLRVLVPEDPRWPTALNDLGAHAPLVLWMYGAPEVLMGESVSIVGARNVTGYGAQVTTYFAECATRLKRTIVSGAAFGVDAIAHRCALSSQTPTVAVLAGGADRPYPLAHEQLLTNIKETGAVISELIPGAPPTRWRFLQRNRLIAALSPAVLVTEAGIRSGAINTAGHAAQLGREVGAVPGPITAPSSHGCFRIMNEYGAHMITTEQEFALMLGETSAETPTNTTHSSTLHRRVLDALPLRGKRSTAEIVRNSGVEMSEAVLALVELETLASVRRHGEQHPHACEWSLNHKTRVP